ncbi:unnamed protein product [Trichobilharzia szidati]|nr:unnamed protein product [Trichobilharzia szidati]
MMILFTIIFNWILFYVECQESLFQPDDNQLVSYINQYPTAGWKAESNSILRNIDGVQNSIGAQSIDQTIGKESLPTVSHTEVNITVPKYFDARSHWKNCSDIQQIHDESQCISNWAIASAKAISDRICIKSHGKIQVNLSVHNLISCCGTCGHGCHNGHASFAWHYWKSNGLVTEACQPYIFPHCEHYKQGKYRTCGVHIYRTPLCKFECIKGYTIPYEKDKFYGETVYNVNNRVEDIQKEILLNGPVTATLDMFTDFPIYKSGIYKHITGNLVGMHTVRIIGWGEEDGIAYWLCANSWNEDWGENGYFRIIRGENECFIESFVVAGIPKF